MTPRELQIVELIRRDPFISQQELARRLGIGRSAVAGHVMRLTARGVIRGRGYMLAESRPVLCIGAANLDMHGRPDGPLAPRRSTPGQIRRTPGGAARNVAENLARLGVDVRLVSVVGRDPEGEYLLDLARASGIDTTAVHRSATGRTSTYLSILDEGGDTRLAINDMAILAELNGELLNRALAPAEPEAPLIADSNLDESALRRIAVHPNRGPLFVDSVSPAKAPRLKEILPHIASLKSTLADVRALAGRRIKDADAAAAWLSDQGVGQAFVTRGADGVNVATSAGERSFRKAATNENVVSTSGAGDAFLAGLVHAAIQGLDLESSLDHALELSALAVASPSNVIDREARGTITP